MNLRTCGGIAVLGWTVVMQADAAVPHGTPDPSEARRRLTTLTVPFVPNAGQWDRQAAFAAQTFAGTMFVTTAGALVYSLPGRDIAAVPGDRSQAVPPGNPHGPRAAIERTPGWVLTETFIGADRQPLGATPIGARPAAAKVSYFVGNDEQRHQRGLDSYERIDLGEVFPGINVQLRATGTNVEKIFTVAPREDPAQIQLRIGGATRLELGAHGELIAHTGNGPLAYTAPIAFQEDGDGVRQPVAVRYILDRENHHYGFALASYDPARPLVIDPLLQSTYLGAEDRDFASAIAIHPINGQIYVSGETISPFGIPVSTFPGVGGGAYGSSAGYYDAFVSRFNADLTILLQSSYLGTDGYDLSTSLAIHPLSGDVYVGGYTNSTATPNFPGVGGGAQATPGGGNFDGFVSRFNADLTVLHRSTYLGAANSDLLYTLAIHPLTGEIYAGGTTQSLTNTFPGVGGGAQGSTGGGSDAFISRFNSGLTTLLQATYFGGAGIDGAAALAIHPASGEVYAAGYTSSTAATLPGAGGGAQANFGGGLYDAFASRFNANLTTRLQSTYLGAGGDDRASGLAIHPSSGDVYVAGSTDSTTNTFPGVGGGAQGNSGGAVDAFVSRFNANLTTLVRSTYLGAAGDDRPGALAIHPVSGEVYVAGSTASLTNTFPGVSGGAQGTFGGGANDGFVSRFSADLATLFRSSYLGASGQDAVGPLAIHPATGQIYVAGATNSATSTFPGVSGAPQGTFGGGTYDGFVSRFSLDLQAVDVVPGTFMFTAQMGVPPNVLRESAPVQINGLGALATVTVSGALGSAFCVSTGNDCSCNATAGSEFTATPGTIANTQFICARHVSAPIANDVRATAVVVGGAAARFLTATGSLLSGCSLDVDGNGAKDALTDGLILIRAMFGLTGTAVTNNAIGSNPARSTWAQIQPYLNGNCGTNYAP